ncbi:MAG: hypothetical protein GEU93_20155 [Propionibacteriales bacterium]|nr:hypothetical protein [Propionibacteriales bacterium]
MSDELREGDEVVARRELSSSVNKNAEGKVIRVHGDKSVTVRFDNGVERERVSARDLTKKKGWFFTRALRRG